MDYTEDFYFTAVENVLYRPLQASKWPIMASFKSLALLVIQSEAIRGHLKVIRGQYNTFTTAVKWKSSV